ncbi:MAG: hypothetical protein JWO38_2006 [Gemmataceae bacterium]|nr:hypothetical protein [Gemmataceae bacterium]
MPRLALGPVFAATCILVGSSWGGSAAAPPPAENPAQTASALRQLRKPIHEWLARDIGVKTRAENRAYADLILAFGLARSGEPDEAKALLREAAAVLGRGDPAHQCLVALYRHRIEQVLVGKPPTGPFPADLLAGVTPTGDERANAPIKRHHYIVLRAREVSRILEPLEQVDPYLPWTSTGTDEPILGKLGALQDEQDPERFGRGARIILKESGSGSVETRVRVTAGLIRLAPRAGEPFCVELLKLVPALARTGREAGGQAVRDGVLTLVEQALALATSLKKPELLKPLVAEAVALIRTERGGVAVSAVARLTVRCERGFRVQGLRTEAAAFLTDTAGKLPTAADVATLRTAGESWADAARARLAEAGVRQAAGQDAEAAKICAVVREIVLDPPAGPLGSSYYRLLAEYSSACGRLPLAEAKKRLEEILVKSARVPDTFTTATHYSRYHLMIVEAAVLALSAGDDF